DFFISVAQTNVSIGPLFLWAIEVGEGKVDEVKGSRTSGTALTIDAIISLEPVGLVDGADLCRLRCSLFIRSTVDRLDMPVAREPQHPNPEWRLLQEVMDLRTNLANVRKTFRDTTLAKYVMNQEIERLADVPSLVTVHNLRAHNSRIHDVIWSPEDNYLISVGADNCIIIWDTMKGLIHNTVDATGFQPLTAAIVADMDLLFAGGLSSTVVCLTHRHRLPDDGYSEYTTNVVYEHSGKISFIYCIGRTHILTGADTDGAIVWDVEKVKQLQHFPHPRTDIQCVESLREDAATFLTGSSDSLIRQFDRRQANSLVGIFSGHESDVTCIRALPAGNCFVSGSEDTFVNLYDLRLDSPLCRYSKPYRLADMNRANLTYRTTEAESAGAGEAKTATRMSMASGVSLNEETVGSEEKVKFSTLPGVCDLAVSSSGRLVISGCKDSVIYFWDLLDPNACLAHQVEQGPVVKVTMSNRKTGLALLTWDQKTRLRIVRPQ
ncbi:unnamed protein product, partial [Protopolystoma xenopodis]